MSGYITPELRASWHAGLGQAPPDAKLFADVEVLSAGPAPLAAAGSYTLTNHGGSVIATPRLVLLAPGAWVDDLDRIEQFAADVMEGGYLDGLAPYGSGRGTYWGLARYADARFQTGMTVTAATIADYVRAAIAAGVVPQADANTLFMVLAPPGVIVSDDNRACEFCGWHTAGSWDGGFYYGVVCDTSQGCCHAQFTPFQAACMVLAHEIAEACTDAVPGRGWYCDQNGQENADLCAWQPVQYGPWTVQPYWTNEHGPYCGPYEDHHSARQGGGTDGGQSGQQGGGTDPYAALWTWLPQALAYAVETRSLAELKLIRDTITAWLGA